MRRGWPFVAATTARRGDPVRARLMLAVGSLALAALATVALAPGAATQPTRPATEGDCGTETVSVLFWPRGHGAIASLGFPKSLTPHVEVYRYAARATYRDANFLAYADGTGKSSLRPRCKRASDHATLQQLPATSRTRSAAVTCRTRLNALVQVRRIAGGGVRAEVRVIEKPNRLVLRALVTGNAIGSKLAYNPSRCRVGNPPG